MLFSLLLATAAASTQLDQWRALIQTNADSNPHAQYDIEDMTGYHAWIQNLKLDVGLSPSAGGGEGVTPEEVNEMRGAKTKPSVDWRTKGAVTAVKNQGAFGTCWSFAAAENLEGLNARQGHKLQNISNQELIDCCPQCQGRSADFPFTYLLNNSKGMVDTEDSYPYLGPQAACKTKQGTASTVHLNTFGRTQDDGSGAPIVASLMKYGPMGHGVDATCFAGYKGGVITNCTKSSIDHAVLMVGAGTDEELKADYYIIKNSWGAKWGEHGYVRVARGTPKQCGIGSTVWTM